MTSKYCPIISSNCRDDECVMWFENSCALVDYLLSRGVGMSSLVEKVVKSSFDLDVPPRSSDPTPSEKDPIQHFLSTSKKDLAKEMLRFVKDNDFYGRDRLSINYEAIDLFWSKYGLQRFGVPIEVNVKQDEVKILVEKMLRDEIVEEFSMRTEAGLVAELCDYVKDRTPEDAPRNSQFLHSQDNIFTRSTA